jgi:hypothetical protein
MRKQREHQHYPDDWQHGTLPTANGTLKGRFLPGSRNRSLIIATCTAANTSNTPNEDTLAIVLISPSGSNMQATPNNTSTATHGVWRLGSVRDCKTVYYNEALEIAGTYPCWI